MNYLDIRGKWQVTFVRQTQGCKKIASLIIDNILIHNTLNVATCQFNLNKTLDWLRCQVEEASPKRAVCFILPKEVKS